MAEDSISQFMFTEPTVISSRDMISQVHTQVSVDGSDYFYSPGSSARIEISNVSQNAFILPRTMSLVYHAISLVQTLSDGSPSTPPAVDTALATDTLSALRFAPGIPFIGCPHLASVQTEIPGLSSTLSQLSADGQSQQWYASRLLCSGNVGVLPAIGCKGMLTASGRAHDSGLRSIVERGNGITGSVWRTRSGPTNTVVRDYCLGSAQKFTAPASAWLQLADGATTVLPLGYLTASSANLNLRVNFAPVSSAVTSNPLFRPRTADLVSYLATGVEVQWTQVSILNPMLLTSIQQLYRGQASLPISVDPPMSVPQPMVMSFRQFNFARTSIPAQSGQVSLRIPAGMPCATAVMVRIDAPIVGQVPTATQYLTALKPIIKNFQISIGSARFPSRCIEDLYIPNGSVPRGLGSSKWALVTTDPNNAANSIIGGATFVDTSSSRCAELYRECRSEFSLFDDDDYCQSGPAEVLWNSAGPSSMSAKASGLGNVVGSTNQFVETYAYSGDGNLPGLSTSESTDCVNMFCVPLMSLLPEASVRKTQGAFYGIDTRNVSDVTVSFEIVGVAPRGINLVGAPEAVQRWDVYATLAGRQMATLLPGRVDLFASNSLIPSAAGAITAGGV